ncbi:MAG: BadF/BadG/BcrA/BcrD ATPase family protein [Streptosporangiaceae bacterium]
MSEPPAGSGPPASRQQASEPGSTGLAAILAIDGGNSKTDAALVAADGKVLGQARGGGSNPQVIGMERAIRALRGVVAAAAARAGLQDAGLQDAGLQDAGLQDAGLQDAGLQDAGQHGGAPVARHTSACLAGADLPEEEAELGDLVQGFGWSQTTAVVNDTFAVLRAGLDDDPGAHWGVAVTCGAGINCVGVAPDGATTRFLSFGPGSGDWGGGGDIGPATLWWAIRAEDGRGPQTALRTAVPAHFGLTEVRDVAISVHLGKITHDDLYGLTPVLFEVAAAGDQVARDVVIRLAEEIGVMALTAARRLGIDGLALPVVLGGSLLRARDALLTGEITRRIGAAAPAAIVRIVDAPPVTGAALLGLDYIGAPASAYALLRAASQP